MNASDVQRLARERLADIAYPDGHAIALDHPHLDVQLLDRKARRRCQALTDLDQRARLLDEIAVWSPLAAGRSIPTVNAVIEGLPEPPKQWVPAEMLEVLRHALTGGGGRAA